MMFCVDADLENGLDVFCVDVDLEKADNVELF